MMEASLLGGVHNDEAPVLAIVRYRFSVNALKLTYVPCTERALREIYTDGAMISPRSGIMTRCWVSKMQRK
jgi:hypothetical protein